MLAGSAQDRRGDGREGEMSGRTLREKMARERIARRLRAIRDEVVLDKNTYEHWNRTHPDEEPLDTSWCDEIIAWCDGAGPLSPFVAGQ